jgi:hypothetical protein
MKIRRDSIDCPNCGSTVNLPWLPSLKHRKMEDDYDRAEIDAQEILNDLWNWLSHASLWSFIKFWFNRK